MRNLKKNQRCAFRNVRESEYTDSYAKTQTEKSLVKETNKKLESQKKSANPKTENQSCKRNRMLKKKIYKKANTPAELGRMN